MKIHLDKTNIVKPMVMYWIVLVVYKAFFPLDAKSTVDLVIKSLLLLYLIFSFIFYPSGKVGIKAIFFPFVLCLLIPFLHESYTAKNVIIYAFVIIFTFLTMGNTKQYIITKDQLIWFYNTVIIVMVIASIYSAVFDTSKFLSVSGYTSAYGNELKSFFDSSHIYGLYLSGAIIACLICLDQVKEISKRKYYYISLILLIPNLILTFSRTAIFSTAVFGIVYILLGKNKILKRSVIILSIAASIVVLTNDAVQKFLFSIVFKAGNMAGRDTLLNASMNIYNQLLIIDKIFGIGFTEVREELVSLTGWESAHNAYVEILLAFGILGIIWIFGLFFFLLFKYIRLFAIDKKWSVDFLCLLIWCFAMMLTNTFIIFTSSVDSYFLTIFAIVVPQFYANTLLYESSIQ